jgi:hypothetical protein
MTEPLSPELEARAQELAARIAARSAADILDMARRLVTTTDATLFGDTEFALRDATHRIAAHAYTEHVGKKRGTSPRPSTAPTADAAPPSTATAREPSQPSAARSRATARTTPAARAAKGRARGTPPSV